MIHSSAACVSFIGTLPMICSDRSALRDVTTTEADDVRAPMLAVTRYVPERSATKPPSASTVAPDPLTAQRGEKPSLPPVTTARNRTTSPALTLLVPGSINNPVTVLATTDKRSVVVAGPAMAQMFAAPGAIPVTTPAASTVATSGLSEVQEIATSVRGSP